MKSNVYDFCAARVARAAKVHGRVRAVGERVGIRHWNQIFYAILDPYAGKEGTITSVSIHFGKPFYKVEFGPNWFSSWVYCEDELIDLHPAVNK